MTREEAKLYMILYRQRLIDSVGDLEQDIKAFNMAIQALEQEPKQGYCRDCKWWKDSDGSYRRGVSAESECPINSKTVYDGEGYCYLFSKNK